MTDTRIGRSSCPACPRCDGDKGATKDSRPSHDLGFSSIRRRIECTKCGFRFTTREVSDVALDKFRQEILENILTAINGNYIIKLLPVDEYDGGNPSILEMDIVNGERI